MSFEFKETPLKTVSLTVWSNPAYMKANERERMLAYICEYDGKCPMYEKGKCVCQNLIFGEIKCPHARRVQASGLTKRASGFGKAASRWKEMYKTEIQIENVMLCECGDYIYLPYPHLDVFGRKPIEEIERDRFLHKTLFTIENIHKIINWHPRSLMGGIITDFQEKEVPKFIRQLRDVFPDLYAEYLNTYPDDKTKFEAICVDYVGRKAYLNTLKDGTTYRDCHGDIWVKNGEFLVCEQMKTTIHMPIGRKPRKVMQQMMGDEIVTVSKNDDVSENTVFVE